MFCFVIYLFFKKKINCYMRLFLCLSCLITTEQNTFWKRLRELSRICLFVVVDLGMSSQPCIGTVVERHPEEVELKNTGHSIEKYC